MGFGLFVGIIFAVCGFGTALYQGWSLIDALGIAAVWIGIGIFADFYKRRPR